MVRGVTREILDLDRDAKAILEPFGDAFNPGAHPAVAYTLLVHHLCMRRNKRCLLAYHRGRVERIEAAVWTGGAGEDDDKEEGAEEGLSPEEEAYARGYADLLARVKGRWTDVDLTGSLEPPRDLFVDVRVLKDAGEIQTEYGYVAVPAGGRRAGLIRRRGQRDQLDKKQPVFCAPGRRGAADSAGLFAETGVGICAGVWGELALGFGVLGVFCFASGLEMALVFLLRDGW